MKPLTLTRKGTSSAEPLDLRNITPNRTQAATTGDIGRLELLCKGESRDLASEFDIQDGDRSSLRLAGDLSNCSHVGSLMQSGVLEVESSVGSHLAAQMRGGVLRVNGDAGDHAFCSMRGGEATVSGNVGSYAGGGDSKGMRGGRVVVKGNAGRWLAARMRRGTIVVHGSAGPGAASRLIAGTLFICGPTQPPLGAGMQRGTIILPAPRESGDDTNPLDSRSAVEQIDSIVGFTDPEPTELSFLQLLLRELKPLLPPEFLDAIHTQKAFRALGDRAAGGRGEILWLRRNEQQSAW